ncbi:hypothetical protein CVT24_000157 [Panaeolus cyanescens]|uniref:non-specific serine/threonine protein kinase n=1 Tax=Panaeolus cyanescens TaxID=181874 RepID=A0A409VIV4_9AGAR|nr:hypothetical protein CVT24_000157 [Panaeolus cyanescens]
MHVLSHHSSNPLEAHPSDPVNRNYKRLMSAATRRNHATASHYVASSEDPLFLGHGAEMREEGPSKLMGPAIAAGRVPARFLAYDLDQAMVSDDELGTPVKGDAVLVTPVKQGNMSAKGKGKRRVIIDSDDEDMEQGDLLQNVVPAQNVTQDEDEEDGDRDAEGEDDDEMGVEEELMYAQDEMDFAANGEEMLETYEDENADFILESDEDEDMHDDTLMMGIHPDDLIEGLSPLSSPQSSRPPSPDEYISIRNRPIEEQEEIEKEISDLCKAVPEIPENYELVDRLGTGTFSSVYKAVDLNYSNWDNRPWLGNHPPDSSAFYQSAGPGYRGWGGRAAKRKVVDEETGEERYEWGVEFSSAGNVVVSKNPPGKVYVALKRIYNTSGPDRIRNELEILETCRSCRHTSQLITAFRNMDQVVIVLPYQRNLDFRVCFIFWLLSFILKPSFFCIQEYFQTLPLEGVKCYLRCLLRALRDIHSRGIIHRDVKPANFLYDPFTGVGTLCDFGLASHMETHAAVGRCFHTGYTEKEPHGRNLALEQPLKDRTKMMQIQAREYSKSLAEKVGYPDNDRRWVDNMLPLNKANRAGTRGFRAPEVLLKCTSQTGAIDVWSTGIILLFFLTGKFPIFQSNDDIEALMEIAVIIGRRNMEKTATLHSRTFSTNIKDVPDEAVPWEEFVKRLNPDITKPNPNTDYRFYPYNSKHRDGRGTKFPLEAHNIVSSPIAAGVELPDLIDDREEVAGDKPRFSPGIEDVKADVKEKAHYTKEQVERHEENMKTAFALLEKLLRPESTKRITPKDALAESFLREKRRVDHVPGNQQDAEEATTDKKDRTPKGSTNPTTANGASSSSKYEWIDDDDYIPIDAAQAHKSGQLDTQHRAVCADLHHPNNMVEVYRKCLCGQTCHDKKPTTQMSWRDHHDRHLNHHAFNGSDGGVDVDDGDGGEGLTRYFQDISPSPVRNGEDLMWEEEYAGVKSREVLGAEDVLVSDLNGVWKEGEDETMWCGRYRRILLYVPNGMGVAVGRRPCEFHTGYCFDEE